MDGGGLAGATVGGRTVSADHAPRDLRLDRQPDVQIRNLLLLCSGLLYPWYKILAWHLDHPSARNRTWRRAACQVRHSPNKRIQLSPSCCDRRVIPTCSAAPRNLPHEPATAPTLASQTLFAPNSSNSQPPNPLSPIAMSRRVPNGSTPTAMPAEHHDRRESRASALPRRCTN
jgi:hypothetical protein